jgi:hypothetical protein
MSQAVVTCNCSLPDVNQELHPYTLVQHLLDATADFQMLAVPARHGTQNIPLGGTGSIGTPCGSSIAVESVLHRFESVAQMPGARRGIAHSQTGEASGLFRGNWFFTSERPAWSPGHESPSVPFNPWQSQHFSIPSCEFRIGRSDVFVAYGLGRTFPIAGVGTQRLLAAGAGNLTCGQGREGTFVFTGSLLPGIGFLGNITLRVLDFNGDFRSDRDLAPSATIEDAAPDDTFLVVRLVKKNSSVRTTWAPVNPDFVELVAPAEIRSTQFRFTAHRDKHPRTVRTIGPVIGEMVTAVALDFQAPPGTHARPLPFASGEKYTFLSEHGQPAGTIEATVTDGISFGVRLPSLPDQPALRLAGYGPIRGGTGIFEGARGLLAVNSLIGLGPNALSLIHVLHLDDADGRFRACREPKSRLMVSGCSPAPPPAPAPNVAKRQTPPSVGADPFQELVDRTGAYKESFRTWRRNMHRCSGKFSEFLAALFNSHRKIGDFTGLEISPASLRAAFEAEVQPFNERSFDIYSGRGKAGVKTYRLPDCRQIRESDLYGVWERRNYRRGILYKRITAATDQYFHPSSIPPVDQARVDLFLNAHDPDVGVTSWMEKYQAARVTKASIAYDLPHEGEILWFGRDVGSGGQPASTHVVMPSHEWQGLCDDRTCYFMVGFFVVMDFDECKIDLAQDVFWRARYVQVRED